MVMLSIIGCTEFEIELAIGYFPTNHSIWLNSVGLLYIFQWGSQWWGIILILYGMSIYDAYFKLLLSQNILTSQVSVTTEVVYYSILNMTIMTMWTYYYCKVCVYKGSDVYLHHLMSHYVIKIWLVNF